MTGMNGSPAVMVHGWASVTTALELMRVMSITGEFLFGYPAMVRRAGRSSLVVAGRTVKREFETRSSPRPGDQLLQRVHHDSPGYRRWSDQVKVTRFGSFDRYGR